MRSQRILAVLALLCVAWAKPECASFTPKTCLFGSDVKLTGAQCKPHECDFNAEQEFKCGFTETGSYTHEDQPFEGCEDPFLSSHRLGLTPCGSRCCSADHAGDFSTGGEIPGSGGAFKYEFQPTDSDCRYTPIVRGQVLHFLHSRGIPLAVIGDSMMRQLFLRLVGMMRGQQRLLDYHLHTHAAYTVCHEADSFRISTNSANATSSWTPNIEHLKAKIPTFFRMAYGPGRAAGRAALAECSRSPINFHYVHSPKYKNQEHMVPVYIDSLPPGVKPVILIHVGYWEGGKDIPQSYLKTLAALADRAHRVFIVGVPTAHLHAGRRRAFRVRNDAMAAWVEKQGDPFAFVDFDKLAGAQNAPPAGAANSWHYMCGVEWEAPCEGCANPVRIDHTDALKEMPSYAQYQQKNQTEETPATAGGGAVEDKAAGGIVPQVPAGKVERIHATEDGLCADEMGRNMWQLVFNALLQPAEDDWMF